jgi:hypothetical protein
MSSTEQKPSVHGILGTTAEYEEHDKPGVLENRSRPEDRPVPIRDLLRRIVVAGLTKVAEKIEGKT